jgi:response regulator RpfG family c-di-GMP phosphodiesterase
MKAMKEEILFVDDDPNILEAYQRKLQSVLNVRTAGGPRIGLAEIQDNGPFAVVIADMNMPLMNGIEFLEKVQKIAPDTVRMMLTGNADINVVMEAVNSGNVFRFLTKPCPSKLMGESLIAGIKQYRLITAEKELLECTLKGVVELLAEILSWINPEAFGRTMQIRTTAMSIASKIHAENAWEIELAATLSHIGTMALPQELFTKMSHGALLDADEQQIIASVPAVGQELLKHISRLDNVAKIVLYQNKHYDGAGFPEDAVVGKNIPMGARILKVAGDLHELRGSGKSVHEALKQMKERTGWYDPAVLTAAIGVEDSDTAQAELYKVVQISLQELKAGFKLAAPITTSDNRKLVAAGTEVSEALLIRLKNFAEVKGVTEPIEILIRSHAKDQNKS